MKLQQLLMKLFALSTTLLLFTACTNVVEKTGSIPPSITLNGVKVENSGLVQKEGAMYIPASFITEVLGADLQLPEAEQLERETDIETLAEGVYYTNKVGVLMYHAIMEEPTNSSIISAKQFTEHLQWLKDEGFVPISIEQYTAFIHEDGEVPDNAVLITFDDGYENFYTYAYPALKQFGFPAVNFVIVAGVDDPDMPGIKKLTWEQMREMKQHNIAFHSHTYNMHMYGAVNEKGLEQPAAISKLYLSDEQRAETDEEYTARVTEDLSKAEQRLAEELGNTLHVIAFPYGAYNEHLLSIMNLLGITTSFTVKAGINSADDVNGYRINAGRSDQAAAELLAALKLGGKTAADNGKAMLLNGKLVSFSNVIENSKDGTELYSLREVSDELGVFVGWDGETKTVSLVQ